MKFVLENFKDSCVLLRSIIWNEGSKGLVKNCR